MIRYTLREYFFNTLLSARFLVSAVVLLISLYTLFYPMAVRMNEEGYCIGAFEILPCFLFVGGNAAIYFVLFAFLIMAYPRWEGSLNQIARLGKKRWIFIQYVQIAISAIIYFLIWTIGFIIAFIPSLSWKNEWSSFLYLATDTEQMRLFHNIVANVSMSYSSELMEVSNPMVVWSLTFLLHILGTVFVGVLAVTFNICYRRGVGTILAFFIAGARGFLEGLKYILVKSVFPIDGIKQIRNLFLRFQYYISPLYQSDLSIMAIHNTRPLSERVRIAVVYFLVLIVIVMLYGIRKINKIDLSQE